MFVTVPNSERMTNFIAATATFRSAQGVAVNDTPTIE